VGLNVKILGVMSCQVGEVGPIVGGVRNELFPGRKVLESGD